MERFSAWIDFIGAQPGASSALALSPDGSLLARAVRPRGNVTVWDVRARARRFFVLESTRDLAFDPSGTVLASLSFKEVLTLWRADTAAPLVRIESAALMDRHAFSADGSRFACVTGQGIRILDVRGGTCIAQLDAPAGIARTRFSPDGGILIASADEKALLWRIPDARPFATIEHPSKLSGIDCSPDGDLFACACKARLWLGDLRSAAERSTIDELADYGGDVAFSPDGRLLACGTASGRILLLTTDKRRLRKGLTGHDGKIDRLRFSPDGQRLWSRCCSDESERIWSTDDGEQLASWPIVYGQPTACAADCRRWAAVHGERIVSGGTNYSHVSSEPIGIFEPGCEGPASLLNAQPHRLPRARLPCWYPVLSANGRTLAWPADGAVQVIDMRSGHREWIDVDARSLLLSFDGSTLAAASETRIHAIELSTGRALFEAESSKARVLALSDDGALLATEGPGKKIAVWSLRTGKMRCELAEPAYGEGAYHGATYCPVDESAFSPDGRFLVALKERFWGRFGHTDDDFYSGAILAWNLRSRRPRLVEARGPSDRFSKLGFCTDGTRIAVDFNGTDKNDLFGGEVRRERQIRRLDTLARVEDLDPDEPCRRRGFAGRLDERSGFFAVEIAAEDLAQLIAEGDQSWKGLVGPRAWKLGVPGSSGLCVFDPSLPFPEAWRAQLAHLASELGDEIGAGLRRAREARTVGEALEICRSDPAVRAGFDLDTSGIHPVAFRA
ncbi:MAG: hypothetical protein JXR96_11115 [Deltaproteobacteria bacterium]|nr:hypothetical protein [Deltaproteobacteria bacterium]